MEKILATDANETIESLNTLITDNKLTSTITVLTQEDTAGNKVTSNTFLKLTETINKLETSFSKNCCQSVNTNCCQTCQSCQKNCNCNNYSH